MADRSMARGLIVPGAVSAGGAPTDASYVVIGVNGSLSAERVLTGTANQITLTDNGANGTIVLSAPQNLHTAATPTFAGLTNSALTSGRAVFAGTAGVLNDRTLTGTSNQVVLTDNGAGGTFVF